MIFGYIRNLAYNYSYNKIDKYYINNRLNLRKKSTQPTKTSTGNSNFKAEITHKTYENSDDIYINIVVRYSDKDNKNLNDIIEKNTNIVDIGLTLKKTDELIDIIEIPIYPWSKDYEERSLYIDHFKALSPNIVQYLDDQNKKLFKNIGKEVLNYISSHVSYKYNLSPNTPVFLTATSGFGYYINDVEYDRIKTEYKDYSTESLFNHLKITSTLFYEGIHNIMRNKNDNITYLNVRINRDTIIKHIKYNQMADKLVKYYESIGFKKINKIYDSNNYLMLNTLDNLISKTKI